MFNPFWCYSILFCFYRTSWSLAVFAFVSVDDSVLLCRPYWWLTVGLSRKKPSSFTRPLRPQSPKLSIVEFLSVQSVVRCWLSRMRSFLLNSTLLFLQQKRESESIFLFLEKSQWKKVGVKVGNGDAYLKFSFGPDPLLCGLEHWGGTAHLL